MNPQLKNRYTLLHFVLLMTCFMVATPALANQPSLDSEKALNSVIERDADAALAPNYMPLEIALTLNKKYVGQISAKIDPRTNNGQLNATRFISMIKPFISRDALKTLKSALVADDEFVSFDTINTGGLISTFDSLSLSIDISVTADGLESQGLSVRGSASAPNPDLYVAASNFTSGLNISASEVIEKGKGSNSQVALNGLINIGGFGGVTIEGGARYSERKSVAWERTPIIATKDLFDSAVRVSVGELTPQTRAFQGSRRILGLGIHRSYSSIRPFQTVRPTGRTEFSLDEESTVEIYVNEQRVDTLDLPVGSYSLSDFPIDSRSNDVRLEITNRAGNRETLTFGVYGGTELLAPGISDYGVFVGRRESREKFDYSNGYAASGYYRRGINGRFSVGATGQASDAAQQVGALATFGSRFGLMELEAAASRNSRNGNMGNALRLNYRSYFSVLSENDLRITANGEFRTAQFQHAFEDTSFVPLKWSSAIQATWTGLRGYTGTLGLSNRETRGANAGSLRALNLSISKSLGRFQIGGSLALRQSPDGDVDERFNILLRYRASDRLSSSAQYNSAESSTTFDLRRRSKDQVGGVNLGAQMQDGERNRRARLTGSYNHNRFESAIEHVDSLNRNTNIKTERTQIRLATFVGMSGGSIGIGRPTRSGFVLAKKHKSLKGSTVEIRNGQQFVAKPSFLGAAVLPLARPYSVNRFDVIVDPLPVGYDLGEGSITVFPGHGNSFQIPIGSDASRTAMGFLFAGSTPMALVSGVISPTADIKDKEKWQRPLFTNRGGRFVADKLRAGEYEIIVENESIATFEIPEDAEGLVNVGRIVSD